MDTVIEIYRVHPFRDGLQPRVQPTSDGFPWRYRVPLVAEFIPAQMQPLLHGSWHQRHPVARTSSDGLRSSSTRPPVFLIDSARVDCVGGPGTWTCVGTWHEPQD